MTRHLPRYNESTPVVATYLAMHVKRSTEARGLARQRRSEHPPLELHLRQRLGVGCLDPARAHRPQVLRDRPDGQSQRPGERPDA